MPQLLDSIHLSYIMMMGLKTRNTLIERWCSMNEPATLPEAHVDEVCKRGQGEKTCSFLGHGDGYICYKGSMFEHTIRIRRPKMKAQGDNCSGPPNFSLLTAQASQAEEVPLPKDHVQCGTCKRAFVPSPLDDYYGGTTERDGKCFACLFGS